MTPTRNIDNELTGQIITLVCEAWGITRAQLVSKSRKWPLPWARSQLCRYLRTYAGHDTVSCAAVLKISAEGVVKYAARYDRLNQVYAPFHQRDTLLRQQCKTLCKPTKRK